MAAKKLFYFVLMLVPLAAWGCGDDSPTAPGGGGDPGAVNDYIDNLSYDPTSMLNVQNTGASDVSREEIDSGTVVEAGRTCQTKTYNLKQNFDRIAILRPTTGVIYPGALVKANQSMMDGVPEPVTLPRAPMILSVDLPGMGDNGIVPVDNPTNSSVTAAVSDALEWWNANAYQEGYVNAANSSYNLTTSYSSEQTALDVGLNMSWATGDFEGRFSSFTSATKSVVSASFQQAFYTVTMDTPRSPADVFAPSISVSDVEQQLDSSAPPAYVSSVTYGRIIVMRMETSEEVTSTELEAAFNYGVGRLSAGGSLAARYNSILTNSQIEVMTIGGNASVASELVEPANLQAVITGDNAVYSRENPGVPIAYTVRYLRDDSVAKLGYTTEYTTRECGFTNLRVTVTFSDIDVIADCDGIEGAGDFDWLLQLINASGTVVGSTSGSGSIHAGDKIVPSKRQFVFVVPATENQSFTARIRASEWDQDIFGNTWRDTRMNNIYTQKSHWFRDGAWTSTSGTLNLGNDSDCKLKVSYSFTSEGA